MGIRSKGALWLWDTPGEPTASVLGAMESGTRWGETGRNEGQSLGTAHSSNPRLARPGRCQKGSAPDSPGHRAQVQGRQGWALPPPGVVSANQVAVSSLGATMPVCAHVQACLRPRGSESLGDGVPLPPGWGLRVPSGQGCSHCPTSWSQGSSLLLNHWSSATHTAQMGLCRCERAHPHTQAHTHTHVHMQAGRAAAGAGIRGAGGANTHLLCLGRQNAAVRCWRPGQPVEGQGVRRGPQVRWGGGWLLRAAPGRPGWPGQPQVPWTPAAAATKGSWGA